MTQETLTASPEPATAIEPRTVIAPTADAPIAPYTHIHRFNHTGGVENFTVPPGVTTINARCWGGGGDGASQGGGGGFVTGNIAVEPGETLRIVVDLGGGTRGGGGMSGLFSQRLGQALLIAGGGGGCIATSSVDARGGAGGGIRGSDGRPESRGGWTGTPAHGASGSTGGAGASIDGSHGGRGGNTGQNGSSTSAAGGQVPIPGMGGGGGARESGGMGGGAGYAGGGGGLSIFYSHKAYASGGGGGSSFVNGPGVTDGRTVAGSGTRAGGQDDPQYQSGVGDAGHHGQVVLQWTEFTVAPGGPPDVKLVQGGPVGYPGVHVASETAFAPVSVTVALPAGRDLLFGSQTLADYQLTVLTADLQTTPYPGALSEDGTSLVFSHVDLGLPGTTVMWVAVSAGHGAPLGATSLTFTVGGKPSPSTTIVVTPGFTLSPGGDTLTVERGGSPRYPGVAVRNNGSQDIPLQTVTVTLPADTDLRFGTPANPDHQLTVMDASGNMTAYMGSLSDDGQSLALSDIDLAIHDDGSRSVMWVCVSASDDTPTGTTSVEFTIGDYTSPSTPIDVI
ncbi:hypothetical protein ABZ471_37765 [Streptomyces sp. NPDC005728]|uniref:hypothetical protein n=1 Tax=Streptomyces sp. NPDC005728 TaxID=3157054 RepID=UPI0033D9CD31